jgi:DNA mismatch repair protein MutS2
VRYDRLLQKLENEKLKYEQILVESQRKERVLDQRLKEYTQLKENLEVNKKQYIQQAKVEAKSLLDEVNKKIEQSIRTIKETKADKEKTKAVRSEIEKLKEKVKPEKTVEITPEIRVIEGEILVGDAVRLKDNGAIGEVISIKGKEVELVIGELKSTVKIGRLEKISKSEEKKEKKAIARRTGYDSSSKMMEFSHNLDLRGKRGEEILPLIQNFVDEGYMLGVRELRIIHGKGNGILKDLTRNFLRSASMVLKMEDDHADRGGAGVTIVTLK